MRHGRPLFESALRSSARGFPIVTVLGPRQAGKSILCELAFPGFKRFDLEEAGQLEIFRRDPVLALESSPRIAIDEAQRFPELFPILRAFVDRHPRHRIVLLGSASPTLIQGISESLTGRTGFFELPQMSVLEADPDKLWVQGGYPRLHWGSPRARPESWYPAYLRTFLEQDIPQLGYRIPALRARALLTMLAHSQGQVCNLSELGGSLGIDYHSVSRILDLFEGTYLVRRLQPYFENLRKRMVRAPKVYVRHTGILHSLLGIRHELRAILEHPKAGASYETFCVEQILSHAAIRDPLSQGYFFRTHSGVECDLVLKMRGTLIPIEIKLSRRPQADIRHLERCLSDLGVDRGYQVYRGDEPVVLSRKIVALPLLGLMRKLRLLGNP